MMRQLYQTAAAGCLVIGLFACDRADQGALKNDPARRGTVILDIDGGRVVDPQLWNPYVPGSRLDHGYHQALLEPLFILNYESGKIMPWLGETMTANEAMDVWTLKLREGIRWSDGEPFNADDVVFTVELLLDHAPELIYSAALKNWIKSVNKSNDLTVKFVLNQPNPRFQLDYWSVKLWGSPPILPEHIWKDQDPLTFKFYNPENNWPVATGPYRLESVSETDFVYVRRDDWWGATTGWKPLPKPEKLIWVWYGPEETRTAAMADHQLDSLMDITRGAFLALKRRNPNVIAWVDEPPFAWLDPCSRLLELNHTVEPWNDKDMRWALNFAIDRDQIVEIAYENTTQPSRHFFPAYPPLNRFVDMLETAGHYEEYPLTRYDPNQTRQILEDKGYVLNAKQYYEKDGKQLSLDITTHEAFIEKQRIAQVIVEQLQRIGINATTRNEAGGTWSENFAFGRFEARMGWSACGSINEPFSSMDTFNKKWLVPVGERAQFNAWRWSNEQYSKLVNQMGSLPLDANENDELFVEAMIIWLKHLPVIPITQARKLIPFDTTYWTGWPSKERNYLHSTTWWQSTHLIIHHLEPAQ